MFVEHRHVLKETRATDVLVPHETRPRSRSLLRLATLETSGSCSAGCEMLTQDGPLKPTGGVDTGGHSMMDY